MNIFLIFKINIILQTSRLFLREFTAADAALVYKLNSDPEVVTYVHEAKLKTMEDARAVIDNIILPQYKNKLGRWAMHIKETNEFIGWCGLKYLEASGETDIGYRLKKAVWRFGFATEAVAETLKYRFDQVHLKEIVGRENIDNTASIHILKKIGMRFLKDEKENDELIKIFIATSITDQETASYT